jgi:hypothetical protein
MPDTDAMPWLYTVRIQSSLPLALQQSSRQPRRPQMEEKSTLLAATSGPSQSYQLFIGLAVVAVQHQVDRDQLLGKAQPTTGVRFRAAYPRE